MTPPILPCLGATLLSLDVRLVHTLLVNDMSKKILCGCFYPIDIDVMQCVLLQLNSAPRSRPSCVGHTVHSLNIIPCQIIHLQMINVVPFFGPDERSMPRHEPLVPIHCELTSAGLPGSTLKIAKFLME